MGHRKVDRLEKLRQRHTISLPVADSTMQTPGKRRSFVNQCMSSCMSSSAGSGEAGLRGGFLSGSAVTLRNQQGALNPDDNPQALAPLFSASFSAVWAICARVQERGVPKITLIRCRQTGEAAADLV